MSGEPSTLRDQLRDVASRRIGQVWYEACYPPIAADNLAAKAFREGWDRESFDARVVLRVVTLLHHTRWIDDDEPGVEP